MIFFTSTILMLTLYGIIFESMISIFPQSRVRGLRYNHVHANLVSDCQTLRQFILHQFQPNSSEIEPFQSFSRYLFENMKSCI